MSMTMPADFAFEPKVWSDHVMAYWEKTLRFGAMAMVDRTLTEAPGTTKTFPYFKNIGGAESPASNEALSVDKLTDDSFTCTVAEVGKGVGLSKASLYKSAANRERIFAEVQAQMGRVLAEKMDAALVTEINTSGNYVSGFAATATTDLCTVPRILSGKINAFGDRHEEAEAIFLHSQHYLNAFGDSNSGFLKGDALDKLYGQPGFMGRLLGMAVFVTDQVPAGTAISSKAVYHAFIVKKNAYGICLKQDADMEMDYDLLNREYVMASTQWYGVKSFHARVKSTDYRIARLSFCTEVAG